VLAVMGLLPPIVGAISQEIIDVLAIANASRVAMLRRPMSDFRT
jgi:cation transport ATPase